MCKHSKPELYFKYAQGGVFGAVSNSAAFIASLQPTSLSSGPPNGAAAGVPRTVTIAATPYDYPMPVHTTALLMIDFQKDFMLPGGFGDALGKDVGLLKVHAAPIMYATLASS